MDGISNSPEHTLRRLEEKMFEPTVRHNAKELGEIIADDFIEMGRDGRPYTKGRIIAELQQEAPFERTLSEFGSREVSPQVFLVTYRAQRRDPRTGQIRHTRRSSIWRQTDGRWQMAFHRGVPVRSH
jgi:hypothetical protein